MAIFASPPVCGPFRTPRSGTEGLRVRLWPPMCFLPSAAGFRLPGRIGLVELRIMMVDLKLTLALGATLLGLLFVGPASA